MSFLDSITGFETVQFIIVVGIAALVLVAMVIRAKSKSDLQSYIEAKESRVVNHQQALEMLQAKSVAGSVPGNANKALAVQND